MSDVHLFIFSKGRVGQQKTLNYIPEDVKRNNLTFVTPKNEVKQHRAEAYGKKLDIMAVPNDIQLADKRMLVIKEYEKSGGNYFLFLDDDLKLSAYVKDEHRFVTTRKLDDSFISNLLLNYSRKLFKEYQCVSFGCLGMSSRMKALKEGIFQEYNKKACCIFGYSAKRMLKIVDKARFNNIWGIDTIWNLETIRTGGKLVTDMHLGWQTEFDPAKNPGGASTYRSTPAVLHSFLRMMLLHPGVIHRGKQGTHIHSFLRIDWRHADKIGTPEMNRKGAERFFDEIRYQNTSIKKFLADCPEGSKKFYRNRIDMLESTLS